MATHWLPTVELERLNIEWYPSESGGVVTAALGAIGHKIRELALTQVEIYDDEFVDICRCFSAS